MTAGPLDPKRRSPVMEHERDTVALSSIWSRNRWWRCEMTNSGPIDPPGIPATGKRVEYEGADFHEYRDGKVARLRIVFDMADIFRQLGLLPERDSAG